MDREARYDKWKKLIEEQEQSGFSQLEFCKRKNLVLSQFIYYRAQIKLKSQSNTAVSDFFAAVQIKPPERQNQEIRLTLPNGVQCILPGAVEIHYLKQLIEMLLSC